MLLYVLCIVFPLPPFSLLLQLLYKLALEIHQNKENSIRDFWVGFSVATIDYF